MRALHLPTRSFRRAPVDADSDEQGLTESIDRDRSREYYLARYQRGPKRLPIKLCSENPWGGHASTGSEKHQGDEGRHDQLHVTYSFA